MTPKIYRGTPKNVPTGSGHLSQSYIWNAERIFVQDINDYAAKILIYDSVDPDPNYFPIVGHRIHMFEKERFGFIRYIEPDNTKVFRVLNIFKKVYSKRYECTAYICRYKNPKESEEGAGLSSYIQELKSTTTATEGLAGKLEEIQEEIKKLETPGQGSEESGSEKPGSEESGSEESGSEESGSEENKIPLGIVLLQQYVKDAVNKAKEEGKTEKEINEITTQAFQDFFNRDKNNETQSEESEHEEKDESKQDNSEPKQEEEHWIKIKKHDGTVQERTRVILELKRILKNETLSAVGDGLYWDNKTQKLGSRV